VNTLRTYKFLIQPVVQVVDEDGDVVDEGSSERPDVVFGVDGLLRYAEGWEEALMLRSAQMNGGPSAS